MVGASSLVDSGWGDGAEFAEDEVRFGVEPSMVCTPDSASIVGVVVNVDAMLAAAVSLTLFQKMIRTTMEPLKMRVSLISAAVILPPLFFTASSTTLVVISSLPAAVNASKFPSSNVTVSDGPTRVPITSVVGGGVGESVGAEIGLNVGDVDKMGCPVGEAVGLAVGLAVGTLVGSIVGCAVGEKV